MTGKVQRPPPDCRRIVIRLRYGIKGRCDRRATRTRENAWFGGVSSPRRRESRAKAARAQAKAAKARAGLAEAETRVAQEQAAAIARALHEDEAHRHEDLEGVAEEEAEVVPWSRQAIPGGMQAAQEGRDQHPNWLLGGSRLSRYAYSAPKGQIDDTRFSPAFRDRSPRMTIIGRALCASGFVSALPADQGFRFIARHLAHMQR